MGDGSEGLEVKQWRTKEINGSEGRPVMGHEHMRKLPGHG